MGSGDLDRHYVAIRGADASIRWGYHVAARLRQWTFAGSGMHGGMVTATIVERDEFGLSQEPLTLVLCLTGRDQQVNRITWPVSKWAPTGDGSTVLVTVGPCERTAA